MPAKHKVPSVRLSKNYPHHLYKFSLFRISKDVTLVMQFIEGKNRSQSILFPDSLDQIVEQDNEVRIIDLFVDSLNLTDFKFIIKTSKEGRPAYHVKDLLTQFVYGFKEFQ